ncbi:hypothetical protein TWF694_009589 [Orbilia ellipsospora]|uniref:Uncharacterized protein n=1 Tax=Orbilia ellipsospora TaxID=2528407 RepID=A0AAV9XC43_9PEZI
MMMESAIDFVEEGGEAEEEWEGAREEIDSDATISDVNIERSDHDEEMKKNRNVETDSFPFDIEAAIGELFEEHARGRLERHQSQENLPNVVPTSAFHHM